MRILKLLCISRESGSLLFINSSVKISVSLAEGPCRQKKARISQWGLKSELGPSCPEKTKKNLALSTLACPQPFSPAQHTSLGSNTVRGGPGWWFSVTLLSSLKQTTAKPLLFIVQKLSQKQNSLVQVIPVLGESKNQLGVITCFWKRGSRNLNLLPGNVSKCG